jgi:spore maturation protein CgeB
MELYAKRSVFRQEKARTFRQATAVLNNLHPSEMASVNCRLFEATGSGAAVLTEYRDALPDLFDMGSEVLAFSRFDELMKHWNALVDDPELGTRIGDAAAKRALADHTYQHRLKVILTDNVA